jgi:hypothetical protein
MSAPDRAAIEAELLGWMREQPWREDHERFERLALDLFAHQFAQCAPYRRFCESRGVAPDRVSSWRDVPAVPTGAFKEVPLRAFPAEQTVKTFRTSGTSGQRRGELLLDTVALYEASLLPSLKTLLFPELTAGERTTIRILAPSPEALPDSSLSHMFGVLLRELGSEASGYDVVDDALDVNGLLEAIHGAIAEDAPVALCGTAFAFVHLLDALEARGEALELPSGSRIMETGGFKGRSRELPRDALYASLSARLGVPEARIVNQYGMSELGSQFYDSVLVDPTGPRRKLRPPWVRVRLIDPESGAEIEPGASAAYGARTSEDADVGMLVIHDLANTGSVAAVATADLGRHVLVSSAAGPGFEVLGREPGAEARGCSIAADVMLSD